MDPVGPGGGAPVFAVLGEIQEETNGRGSKQKRWFGKATSYCSLLKRGLNWVLNRGT